MGLGVINVPDLPINGAFRVRVTEDLTVDGGTWQLAADDPHGPLVIITPPHVPMYLQVVSYLEAKPAPPVEGVRIADETRAATAVCIRWGSYFAVLADADKPLTSSAGEADASQIHDEEMARLNIEISAALEWWFNLASSDDRR